MSQWRREAIERFPELARGLAYAENLQEVWWVLYGALVQSYNNYPFPPVNQVFAERLYGYAHWCLHHPALAVRQEVVEGFCRLPDQDRVRDDMPRWLSQEDFDLLAPVWRYVFTTDEAVAAWERTFQQAKDALTAPASRKKAKQQR